MKRKIFTLVFSAVALMVSAQNPGVTATSIFDDVAQTAMYDDGATDPLTCDWSDMKKTKCGSDSISTSYVRNTSSKKMEYTINVPGGGCWDPAIWVGFTASNVTTGIDISANKTFSIKFTNTGNTEVDVYVDFVDFTKKAINVKANGDALVYKAVAAGQTVPISFDLTGAYYLVDPVTYSDFDFTKVIGMDISVFNNAVDVNWDPLALPANYQVAFTDLKLGVAAGNSVNDLTNNKLSVYPNPVQGTPIIFSQTLTNINVYNAVGEVVISEAQAAKLDVSSLIQGIYLISSTQGTGKLVVE